jgi:hypothetical protein
VILLDLCISLQLASGQNIAAEVDKTEVIHGTVVNSATHEPIARALVFSPDNRFATMSDGQGHFEFIVPPTKAERGGDLQSNEASSAPIPQAEFRPANRPQALAARKPGFLTDSSEEGQNLQVETAGKEITISLMPEALITGRIDLPNSESAFGMRVALYRKQIREGSVQWISAGESATNSGDFRFAELTPGTYKLLTRELLDRDPEASVPGGQQYGYPPAYYPGAADFAAASPIELTAGKTFQADFSVARQPYYSVKLPVSNAPVGVPIEIRVFVHGQKGPGYSLGYNQADQVIEGLLPDGEYTVEAASRGPSAMSGVVSISVKSASVLGPSMVLVRNASISVSVKEEFTSRGSASSSVTVLVDGHLRRGRQLNITLEPADDFGEGWGASFRPQVKPEDKSLVIESVQPGRYWVRVYPFRGFASSVSLGGVNLLQEPLVVGTSGFSSPIEVILRDDGAQIEGKVEGATAAHEGTGGPGSRPRSAPFAYIYCVPLPDSNGQFTQLGVSPDGEFSSPEIPPGAYRILAFKHSQPELEYRNAEAMHVFETKGQVVHLIPGLKQHLELQMIANE